MRGRREETVGRSGLHDSPDIHDRDAVADVPHETKIVRDEKIGQLQFRLQLHQQVDHLGLHRDVEGRDGLVRDHERRVERERAREADALSLSAAELVRVAREMRRIETDEREELADPRLTLRLFPDLVDDERLLHDRSGPHPGVQRRVRILKDDLHVAARAAQPRA